VQVANFEEVWTKGGLFSKDSNSLQWQIVPSRYFLPRHIIDYRYGLLIRLQVQMHNVQDISINVNNLREEVGSKEVPLPKVSNFPNLSKGVKDN
jgi:hypothetical protein